MDDLFYKRLDNWWDYLFDATKYQFLVRAEKGRTMVHGRLAISLPLGDIAEVRFIAGDPAVYFTEPVMNTIFDDITRLVHHYFPQRRRIVCRVTFGNKAVSYEWNIRRTIRNRRLICR